MQHFRGPDELSVERAGLYTASTTVESVCCEGCAGILLARQYCSILSANTCRSKDSC